MAAKNDVHTLCYKVDLIVTSLAEFIYDHADFGFTVSDVEFESDSHHY